MFDKIMPCLWRLNNLIDTKIIRTRAWLTAALDGEWDTALDGDIIEQIHRERFGK